jgi:hypothetical protein
MNEIGREALLKALAAIDEAERACQRDAHQPETAVSDSHSVIPTSITHAQGDIIAALKQYGRTGSRASSINGH